MFLADSHTHSNCSPDSTALMTEMAQAAVSTGMRSISLTDHCDLLSLEGVPVEKAYDWASVLLEYEKMKQKFGTKLELPLGLEFGMGFTNPALAEEILSEPQLDFVIGAAHNLSPVSGGRDYFLLSYETEEECYTALDDYFASLQKTVKSGYYDVLAHIIYPLRYMKGVYKNRITLERYTPMMEDMFRAVAQQGRGIEVNTWRGKSIADWVPILRLYKECGGEIVTVGSDAHAPNAVGNGIQDAYVMLKDLGFSYVATYEKRQPKMISL